MSAFLYQILPVLIISSSSSFFQVPLIWTNVDLSWKSVASLSTSLSAIHCHLSLESSIICCCSAVILLAGVEFAFCCCEKANCILVMKHIPSIANFIVFVFEIGRASCRERVCQYV